MADNAASISTRQPLAKPLTGKDELAELDQLLHFVNDEVEAALNKERNLIDFAADLVCSIDAAGIFRSVNPYSYDLLGYEPEALIGSALLRCLPGDELPKADSMLSGQRDQAGRIFEMRMLRKDKLEVETSWSTIWSRVERRYFCVAHDISERKHVERLKQDYIAMISHDLRSPLMSILGSINMVQMKAASMSQPAKSDLAGAERSVEHLIALVNDLLDFEKLEAGQMEFEMAPLQLSSIFNESEPLVESLLDKFDVRLVFPDNDFKVRADSTKLLQLMANLIGNAIKHSPREGTVKIVSRSLDDAIEVSVHDQGPGVAAQDAERIFQPFEQISERSTAAMGTGLGLAICRLIAQGHKGTIGVRQSDILTGSAFWFTIPTPRR
jgi:PAS domain S-box-containing protein